MALSRYLHVAARVHPQDVRSAHQSMHHLVAAAAWSDTALLAAVAREMVPVLSAAGQVPCFWIIDDTGFRKYGQHLGIPRGTVLMDAGYGDEAAVVGPRPAVRGGDTRAALW